jgi:hypothetical protein
VPAASAAGLLTLVAASPGVPRDVLALAVRSGVEELARRRPGKSVELRVPPFAAAQLGSGDAGPGAGPRHTRGTPPAVVELAPEVFVTLAVGGVTWADAVAAHRVSVSGTHTDLGALFPL